MRINPINFSQYALTPSQVSPVAGAIQQAPQYMQALQKAQQSLIATASAKNALAFQNPLLQQKLTQQKAATIQAMAKAKVANPLAVQTLNLETNKAMQYGALASTAWSNAKVAASTINPRIEKSVADTQTAHQKAMYEQEKVKYLPSQTAAKNIGAVAGVFGTEAHHFIQTHAGATPFKQLVNAVSQIGANPLSVPNTGMQQPAPNGMQPQPNGAQPQPNGIQGPQGEGNGPRPFEQPHIIPTVTTPGLNNWNLANKYMSYLGGLRLSRSELMQLQSGKPVLLRNGKYLKYIPGTNGKKNGSLQMKNASKQEAFKYWFQ